MAETEWKQKIVIGEYAKSVSFDPRKCRSAHGIVFEGKTGSGMSYVTHELYVKEIAAEHKKKKHARATISLPPDVCGECVSDLCDWEIKIIAIKRDKLNRAIDEFKKADEMKKDEQED